MFSKTIALETVQEAWWLPVHARARAEKQEGQVDQLLTQFTCVGLLECNLFSKVWLVRRAVDQNTSPVSLKIIDKAAMAAAVPMTEHVAREREALQVATGCPLVVQLAYPVLEDDMQVYMPLVACLGGSLLLYVQGHILDEGAARFHAACLGLALGALHSRNILHRDIKLESISLTSAGYPTLTDLGSAKVCSDKLHTQSYVCGTPEYAAPEIVRGEAHGAGVDWWALGVVVYRLIAGKLPFVAPSVSEVNNRIQYAPSPMLDSSASLDAREMVQKLLTRDPKQRLSSFQDMKRVPWFSACDFAALEAGIEPSPTPPMTLVAPHRHTEDAIWCAEAI